MFAKIFYDEDGSQILCTKGQNETGFPEFRITFEAVFPEGAGLGMLTRELETDCPLEAEALVNHWFGEMDEAMARATRKEYLEHSASINWEEPDMPDANGEWVH
jgi:hypothetical protein